MTPRDFANLCELVRRRSGLQLTSDKKSLANSRLTPVAHRFGFRDTSALLDELPYPSEEIARAITEALTTNETSFFRDGETFEFIEKSVLPALELARRKSRRIRIWCAAASTGQEAYSIAMMLDAMGLAARGWKLDLIATDISESAIGRAREGVYSPYEVERGLPDALRDSYFVQDGTQWRIADRLRHMVAFRTFNLLDHFGWLGEIDVIFCRNVLLYCEPQAKLDIQAKLADTLADDGYLFVGENELPNEQFVPCEANIYVKAKGAAPWVPRRAAF